LLLFLPFYYLQFCAFIKLVTAIAGSKDLPVIPEPADTQSLPEVTDIDIYRTKVSDTSFLIDIGQQLDAVKIKSIIDVLQEKLDRLDNK
jgi:hypothetical protein